MKRAGTWTAIVSSGSIFLFVMWLFFIRSMSMDEDEPRRQSFSTSRPQGAALQVAHLASNEKIVVDAIELWDQGPPEGFTVEIRGGPEKNMILIERSVIFQGGSGAKLSDFGHSLAHELSERQARGLDTFLEYLRKAPRYYSSTVGSDTYDVTFLRDGREIGREKLIDCRKLPFGIEGDSFESLPQDLQVMFTAESWRDLVTFAGLNRQFEKEANQSPEPTSGLAPGRGSP